MDDFLYSLAEMKYRMWHELFKFKPSAHTEDDCINRLKYLSKYNQVLEINNLLPITETQKLTEIEKEFFNDAPYVYIDLNKTSHLLKKGGINYGSRFLPLRKLWR
jgi:hypothetical protein